MDFDSATPSIVKSIKQRDLLNTWLRLYARDQRPPAIAEHEPTRLTEELADRRRIQRAPVTGSAGGICGVDSADGAARTSS